MLALHASLLSLLLFFLFHHELAHLQSKSKALLTKKR